MSRNQPVSNQATVSVVVAGRNRYEKLFATIQSLMESEYSILEIIYVDTGSGDQLISQLIRLFPSVTVRRVFTGNPQEARNTGAELSRGDYIVFCDDDVIVGRKTIGNLVGILSSRDGAGAIGCACYSDSSMSQGLNCYTLSTPFWLNREGKSVSNAGVFQVFGIRNFIMFKRSVFLLTGGWDTNVFIQGDETDLHYRMHRLGYSLLMDTNSYIIDQTPGKEDRIVIKEAGLSRKGLGVRNTLYSEIKQLSFVVLLWIFPSSLLWMLLRSIYTNSVHDYAEGVKAFFGMKHKAISGRRDSIPRSIFVDLSILLKLQFLHA